MKIFSLPHLGLFRIKKDLVCRLVNLSDIVW